MRLEKAGSPIPPDERYRLRSARHRDRRNCRGGLHLGEFPGMTGQGGGPPVVGIDLGGTKILAAIVGAGNQVLGRAKVPTPAQEGAPAILQAIVSCVDAALADARLQRTDVAAAGVGSPGPLDPGTGVILFSSNLNVRNFARSELSKRWGARCSSTTTFASEDTASSASGPVKAIGPDRRVRRDRDRRVRDPGGGVINGADRERGEIGHIVVKAGGPKCGGGPRCTEVLVSRTAIQRRSPRPFARGSRRSSPTSCAEVGPAQERRAGRGTRRGRRRHDPGRRSRGPLPRARPGSLINVRPANRHRRRRRGRVLGESFVGRVRASAKTQILVDPDDQIRIERAALVTMPGILCLAARPRGLPLPVGWIR